MTSAAPERVVILGGGMAGLTAAWFLSDPDSPNRADVTVYQRGWRLGGKGASSRGVNSRIEEHGLHVLLGHYHHTFDLMDAVYAQLDRRHTDPACPIMTWDEAVKPSGCVSLAEKVNPATAPPEWTTWSMNLSVDGSRPGGEATARADRGLAGMSLADLVTRSLRLLLDFFAPADHAPEPPTHDLVLSSSPEHPGLAASEHTRASVMDRVLSDPALLARVASITALGGSLELLAKVGDVGMASLAESEVASVIREQLSAVEAALISAMGTAGLGDSDELDRFRVLVDLVFTNLRGSVADAVLTSPDGLNRINDVDYCDWLRTHGARESTIDSGIVRGMYDLVFAYEGGDPDRPAFAAGLGLDLAVRMLLDHHGGVFWRMQAGMGEVIFAPLYQALCDRGVKFEFFHNLDALGLDASGSAVATVDLTVQATTCDGGGYRPLIDAAGLPAWPAEPDYGQLDAEFDGALGTSETVWHDSSGSPVRLEVERDFDKVILAVSLGMVPHVAGELIAANGRWQRMVAHVHTVATQALQLWLRTTDAERGWPGPSDTTLSGFRQPFDTWASMAHLLEHEAWRAPDEPVGSAYFCSAMRDPSSDEPVDPAEAHELVLDAASDFMHGDLRVLWPNAVDADGFDGRQLVADGFYARANIDPSDRYVQSVPGSDRHRIAPGDTGFSNLAIAGDWTDCGLNAGCIEAAVRSGRLAALACAAEQRTRAGVGADA